MSLPLDVTDRTGRIWAALVARRGAFDGRHAFLGEVPPDRLEHAAKRFLSLAPDERILAFLDETLGGNGKGGVVLTDRALYTRQLGEGRKVQPLDGIATVDVLPGVINARLLVNGAPLVTVTIRENLPALSALREALVEGLGLRGVTTVTPTAAPANWYPDPAGRHQWRFWDGSTWTERVADQGVEAFDPPGTAAA